MANTHSLDLERGSGEYAEAGDHASLDLTDDFTIEFWVKLEDAPASEDVYYLFSKYTSGVNRSYFCYYYNNGGTPQLELFIYTGTGNGSSKFIYTIPTGEWTHIAIAQVIGASVAATWYINGNANAEDTNNQPTDAPQSGNAPFQIGALNDGNTFDGLIDDFRVWNDIRLAEEIRANMDAELVGDEAGLAAWWKFDNDLTDSQTSGNNDLTHSGTPTFSTDAAFMQKSLDLEASSTQYASITDANQTGLDLTGSDFTIEWWMREETIPGSGEYYELIDKWNANGGYRILHENGGGTPRFQFTLDNGTSSSNVYFNQTLTVETWYHLVLTYAQSSGDAKLYLATAGGSHSQVGSTQTSQTGGAGDGGGLFTIGVYNDGSFYPFDGEFDDVRIWSDVRTTGEMDDNFETELVGNEASLVGYWKLNNNYVDDTGNGNTLTPVASPVFSTDVPFTGAAGPATLKTANTTATASIKTRNGVAIASVKTWDTAA